MAYRAGGIRVSPSAPCPEPILRDARSGEDLLNLVLSEALVAEHHDSAVAVRQYPNPLCGLLHA
jgi:hypothetical protein